MKFNELEYVRPDIAGMVKRIEEIAAAIENETDVAKICALYDESIAIDDDLSTMATICSIRNSINTVDEFYEKENEFFDENLATYSNASSKVAKAMVNSSARKELEKIYPVQIFKLMEVSLKCIDEKIIPELVEESKLVTDYNKLLASAKIEFDGKINNLSQMTVYANNPNREIRKAAELKKVEFMESIESKIDEIYDKLVSVRTRMAKKMGYDNYVDFGYLRLNRTDYNSKDVAGYRKQVLESIVPVAAEIIKAQGKRIGIKDMKSYDIPLFYTDSNPTPKGNKDVLVNKALEMYGELSPETKEFFAFMCEHELMDLETRPNKAGGGYCTMIPKYKAPFIFSNFNGTMGDVDVLTHEAGHAFEAYTAAKNIKQSELYWPTMEACEIHSMSMEFFAHPWMEKFFEEDADKYRYKHLAESITFIPYGVSVDEFQHYVYENPEATPKMRKDKWIEIEKKYTPWKDYDGIDFYERGNFWLRQSHIFGTAFYYIDYTLAQVCAFQFYLQDLENHEAAWNKYYDLCKLGGSLSFTNLLKAVNIDNPFEEGSLAKIMNKLKVVLKELEIK